MPERRRFATPGLLMRAYAAHQQTREGLKKLTEQAEDEQRALDRDLAELLGHLPTQSLIYQDLVYGDYGETGSPVIRVMPAPVASYDLDSWADVEEWEQRDAKPEPEPDAERIGPGPGAPSYSVPVGNADTYPGEVGMPVHIAVLDDDGDDY